MKYKCSVCGWQYDVDEGFVEASISPGTHWDDIPEDFTCPVCKSPKEKIHVS